MATEQAAMIHKDLTYIGLFRHKANPGFCHFYYDRTTGLAYERQQVREWDGPKLLDVSYDYTSIKWARFVQEWTPRPSRELDPERLANGGT